MRGVIIINNGVVLKHIYKADYIPLGYGRPNRKRAISGDEIIDLHQQLAKIQTVDELINEIYGN